MKQKITYGILTVILLGGLYFWLRFTFGLFTPFNFWTARQDIKKNRIKIIEIAEPTRTYQQMKVLAKTYGVEIHIYEGIITIDKENGINSYNQCMFDYLDMKYNRDWKRYFRNQLDSIVKSDSIEVLENKVINVVSREPLVRKYIREVDSMSNGLRHLSYIAEPSPMTGRDHYIVQVVEDNGVNLVTHFTFSVDVHNLKAYIQENH